MKVNIPVIVRLDGTKAIEGAETLKKSGLKFKVAINFTDAAKKVTEVVDGKIDKLIDRRGEHRSAVLVEVFRKIGSPAEETDSDRSLRDNHIKIFLRTKLAHFVR